MALEHLSQAPQFFGPLIRRKRMPLDLNSIAKEFAQAYYVSSDNFLDFFLFHYYSGVET